MKKFTAIAATLFLGSIGFSASAVYLSNPTITPANGSPVFGWPENIDLTWSDQLSLAPEAANETITVTKPNKEQVQIPYGYQLSDGTDVDYGWNLYESGDSFNENTGHYEGNLTYYIDISWGSIAFGSEDSTGTYTISIPEGLVVSTKGAINRPYTLQYTLSNVYGSNIINPDPKEYWDSDKEKWITPLFTSAELSNVEIEYVPNEFTDFQYTGLKFVANSPQVTATLFEEIPNPDYDPSDWFSDPTIIVEIEKVIIDSSLIKIDGKKLILNLSGLTRNGEWTIDIPVALVQFIGPKDTYNNDWQYKFNISNVLSAPFVTPADGSVQYGRPVNSVFNWRDEEGVVLANDEEDPAVYLSFNGTTQEIEASFDEVDGLIVDWAKYAIDSNGMTIPGTYTIVVPAGIVVNGEGTPNAQTTVTYTLYAAAAWQDVDPIGGSIPYTAEELSNVTVSFKEKLTAVENAPAIMVLLQSNDEDDQFGQGDDSGVMPHAEGEPVNNGVLDPSYVKIVNNTIVLDLSFLENGAWYIEIPAGYAQVNATTFTEKVEIYYIVGDDFDSAEVTGIVNGAYYTTQTLPDNATVNWNYQALVLTGEGTITVQTWNEEANEFVYQDVAAADVKLVHANGPVFGDDEPNASDDEGTEIIPDDDETLNALDLNLAPYLEGVTGNVWVNIPEGFVLVNGRANSEYQFEFGINPVLESEPNFLFEAETGVVEVTWPGYGAYVNYPYEEAAYVSDTTGTTTVLTFAEDGVDADVANLLGNVVVDGETVNESIGITVNIAGLKLADGTYTLWIPMGYVVVHNEDYSEVMVNSVAYWQFEVKDGAIVGESSGINGIDNVKTVEGVYNLQGMKMSNDLNTLAPGLYIINGKKVLIRK